MHFCGVGKKQRNYEAALERRWCVAVATTVQVQKRLSP